MIPCLGLFGKGVLLKGILYENIHAFSDIKATSCQYQMKKQTFPPPLLLKTGDTSTTVFPPTLLFFAPQ